MRATASRDLPLRVAATVSTWAAPSQHTLQHRPAARARRRNVWAPRVERGHGCLVFWPMHKQGVREALRALDLESLAGRPLTGILIGLADYVCPGAGTVDAGIPREAYFETIDELISEGLTDLDTCTPDQMQTVFELYATHAIEARIYNDIGTKAVTMPADTQAAHRVEQQLRDFIRGGVSDALTRARAETPNLTPERIQGFVDALYASAFAILHTLADLEADQ